uniref:Small ribosomal subunit protein uS7c n=1 Tax=Euglena longa TaxID=3037 RepID=RR7_EUGLO|nr:ribosomal protein S7 [Euglena longa]P14760.1 RecName: Full=Small ribosomal subunit protein uS7c; AltName: Full=30S ribosomal protein S7, plastid [Euglena longa]CAC24609.1 ribosomal protein S7 [Euglena longa]
MSTRKLQKRKILPNDSIYNSLLVSQTINKILSKGKKNIARYIFYKSMQNIEKIKNENPLDIFKKAVDNATPSIELRTQKRKKGQISKISIKTKLERRNKIALKFIINSAKKRSEKNIIQKLQGEILDAYNNTGAAVQKKEEIEKSKSPVNNNKKFISKNKKSKNKKQKKRLKRKKNIY